MTEVPPRPTEGQSLALRHLSALSSPKPAGPFPTPCPAWERNHADASPALSLCFPPTLRAWRFATSAPSPPQNPRGRSPPPARPGSGTTQTPLPLCPSASPPHRSPAEPPTLPCLGRFGNVAVSESVASTSSALGSGCLRYSRLAFALGAGGSPGQRWGGHQVRADLGMILLCGLRGDWGRTGVLKGALP
nr:PREDICTED: vegetative cell wall protein gp1-like [Opisthocomus hoazin]